MEAHLNAGIESTQTVAHEIKPIERINIQRVIDRWAASENPLVEPIGYTSTSYLTDEGITRYLMNDELIQAPVERVHLDAGPDEILDCVQRGLYLIRRQNQPIIVGIRPPRFSGELSVLEILARNRDHARDGLSDLLKEAGRENIYKGRTITLEPVLRWQEGFKIRFQTLRPTARADIVLPDELLRVVERNILGLLRNGAAMREAGRSLRHGLLFHGPPGTGKSMLVRYLAAECPDHTIVVLTGAQQGMVREGCQVARLLAPSIVVLEDVDLIAQERGENRCPLFLHELLNEMDGLGPRSEVIFLLTTNRPEILEPALASRPGRIDQAIEFPLPDTDGRRKLFEVYGRGLDLSWLEIDRWVDQTDGASPAFIEELLRRAVLMAAERGETARPMRVTDVDVKNALRELVFFGGDLTQKLLGYRRGREDDPNT